VSAPGRAPGRRAGGGMPLKTRPSCPPGWSLRELAGLWRLPATATRARLRCHRPRRRPPCLPGRRASRGWGAASRTWCRPSTAGRWRSCPPFLPTSVSSGTTWTTCRACWPRRRSNGSRTEASRRSRRCRRARPPAHTHTHTRTCACGSAAGHTPWAPRRRGAGGACGDWAGAEGGVGAGGAGARYVKS
jgi:hypothetical protein